MVSMRHGSIQQAGTSRMDAPSRRTNESEPCVPFALHETSRCEVRMLWRLDAAVDRAARDGFGGRE